MNQSPTEILSEIFFQLHQDDQMECMRVCHRWKQIIEEFTLYTTVYVYSKVSLDQLTKQIQRRPEIANKVRRLILCIGEEEAASHTNTLLSLLHNLRTLSYYMDINEWFNKTIIERSTVYPWFRNIEHISEYSRDLITSQLLSTSMCTNLTELVINDYRKNGLELLRNAPALKTLTISFTTISVSELESIHKMLHHLNSISFSSVLMKDFEFGDNIRPATSITECVFINTRLPNLESLKQLLLYISKKYPALSKMCCGFHYGNSCNNDLKHFDDYGWTPFFQKFRRRLKRLFINKNSIGDHDFFEKLDTSFFQINHLGLVGLHHYSLSKLVQSQQIFYIQTLVLKDIKIEKFDWLKELRRLQKLKLICCLGDKSSRSLKLNDILDNSQPMLRSLSFELIKLVFDTDHTGSSYVQTLSFCDMVLPEKTDRFLVHHFPQLSTLKLNRCSQLGKSFDLSTMNLSTIVFTDNYLHRKYNILVLTVINNEQRWYSVDGRMHRIIQKRLCETFYSPNYLPFKTWSENESDIVPDFTLLCKSIRNLILR